MKLAKVKQKKDENTYNCCGHQFNRTVVHITGGVCTLAFATIAITKYPVISDNLKSLTNYLLIHIPSFVQLFFFIRRTDIFFLHDVLWFSKREQDLIKEKN